MRSPRTDFLLWVAIGYATSLGAWLIYVSPQPYSLMRELSVPAGQMHDIPFHETPSSLVLSWKENEVLFYRTDTELRCAFISNGTAAQHAELETAIRKQLAAVTESSDGKSTSTTIRVSREIR